jgi:hypothetical protein
VAEEEQYQEELLAQEEMAVAEQELTIILQLQADLLILAEEEAAEV